MGRRLSWLGVAVWVCALRAAVAQEGEYRCAFARGGWDPAQWLMVKEPRMEKMGEWIQEDDCIRNRVPDGASDKDLWGKRAKETFANMVLKDRIFRDAEIRCVMSFDDRMAPTILVRCAVEKNKDGIVENRDMHAVVIYDEGINVWRYRHEDFLAAKPGTNQGWRKAVFSRFTLLPKTRYDVTVTMKQSSVEVKVGDHHIGFVDETMAPEGHIGICGCEGVNRFYEFSVKETGAKKK